MTKVGYQATEMSYKIPPKPTGKHVSSAKKESLSNLRRSNSASQLSNDAQSEASLSEKNRILVSEVDRLKCLVHEKQNRISELDDENYQFRDYINRLEQEALRLKESYDELEAKYAQAKFDQQKLQAEFNQLMDTQNSASVDTAEQPEGVQKFFKYVQRIASDVNKMMQYKKYLNSSILNLPSRPSILSNSMTNCSLSNSFRQSSRINRRSSLLIHDQNARRSKEESMPLTLTCTMEREELLEKSCAQDKSDEGEEEDFEDQSMREEQESEETQVILDTQPSDNGLQAIEEESECDQESSKAEHNEIIEEEEEQDEAEEEESEEEDEEEETIEETEEIEETVHSSEEEDNDCDNNEKSVHEMTKNYTYVVNETHNVNISFNVAAKTPEPEKKSVKFDRSLDESGDHTKFAKTPYRENIHPVFTDQPKEETVTNEKKKSILKVRTSQGDVMPDRRESQKFDDIEKETNQKSIFKTKKNTPQKKNNDVNQYLEDLVDEAAQNDKENFRNNKVKRTVKTKVKITNSSDDSDNSTDDDFVPETKSKNKSKPKKIGLPPLPGKNSKRPIESVYEQKKVLKPTENLKTKINSNLSQSNQSKEINELDNSANNRSPTINTLLTKKLRLSPDSEDSIDISQPIMG